MEARCRHPPAKEIIDIDVSLILIVIIHGLQFASLWLEIL
jgi:hypothetical protein